MRSSRGKKAPLRMTPAVSDETLTDSKYESSGCVWHINKIPSPLMREGEDEGELLDDSLFVNYSF